ncbi:MAG: prepilin-type N-terminal cleavage/methylation domain-containing protein [Deltaproteobacteria bacterium]|nr:prepilin-type N-terminal cleavage/methylation domain-containing protein [Deltaproteobacteria bacterium]MBW2073037.1 prepilin-type N-terminal cleavage/methylation domain-containing protein [Deltaproteobacteria bacterium]
MSRQQCCSAGFTLLEIVVALAILAVVFTSLYGAYSQTLETADLVERGRDVEQVARLVLLQMKDDLACLYLPPGGAAGTESAYQFVGSNVEADSDGGVVLEFSSTSHLGFDARFPNLSINTIRYVLEKQPEQEKLYRIVRQEVPLVDLQGEEAQTSLELADEVKSVTFNFIDRDDLVHSEWDTRQYGGRVVLPKLVEIRLAMAATGRPFVLKVALGVR